MSEEVLRELGFGLEKPDGEPQPVAAGVEAPAAAPAAVEAPAVVEAPAADLSAGYVAEPDEEE